MNVVLTLKEANEINEKVNKFNAVDKQITLEELLKGLNNYEMWSKIDAIKETHKNNPDTYWALNLLQDIIYKMRLQEEF